MHNDDSAIPDVQPAIVTMPPSFPEPSGVTTKGFRLQPVALLVDRFDIQIISIQPTLMRGKYASTYCQWKANI